MVFSALANQSFKTRITLASLTISLVSVCLLMLYISQVLRDDMQRLLGEQQFASVTYMAAGVNEELEIRLKALETIAAADIMSTSPTTVDVETPTEEVMKLLQEHHILRVPVTEKGKLVGILSRSDLIRAVLEPEFMAF